MMLQRVRAIIGKELIQLRRDRMTFGMIVMIPLIQLLLFGYAINTNIRHIPVGVVDFSKSGLSRVLVQTVSATQVVDIKHYFEGVEAARTAIASAQIQRP